MIKCDPLGFPRNLFHEMRAMELVQTPKKVVQLFQYQGIWRQIWTDGRELPKNAGADTIDAPDPMYYGYSVGKWDGDTFVVDTVGLDGDTWLDVYGDPHSENLKVEERYVRQDHDTMKLTVQVDDPKAYSKPFMAQPGELYKLSKDDLPHAALHSIVSRRVLEFHRRSGRQCESAKVSFRFSAAAALCFAAGARGGGSRIRIFPGTRIPA